MKKILLLLSIVVTIVLMPLFSLAAQGIEERDLPPEADTRPIPKEDRKEIPSITFTGYVNSKDVTIIGGIMGCVYYLCKEKQGDFCSDEEGIIIISGADTGKLPRMIQDMDTAISNMTLIRIKLSVEPFFHGVRRILDVTLQI